MNSPDADRMVEIFSKLNLPDALLVRELLDHLARFEEQPNTTIPRRDSRQNGELAKRREALYNRIRENWHQVKHHPPCLQQCHILKEVCLLSSEPLLLLSDPLEEGTELNITKGRQYGHRALEIATGLGAQDESGEICIFLAEHYKNFTEYEKALSYCAVALDIGARTGNFFITDTAHKRKDEIMTLIGSSLEDLIQHKKEHANIDRKHGDLVHRFNTLSDLAKLLALTGKTQEAARYFEEAAELKTLIPESDPGIVSLYHKYGLASLLYYHLGNTAKAMEIQRETVRGNVENPGCRDAFLWSDLVWLEKLYRIEGRDGDFRAFCEKLKGGYSRIVQWYLVEGNPGPVKWDEEACFSSFPQGWMWVDPLQKGTYKLEEGFEIRSVMGTGILSNVYIPRLMREVEGDFAIEVALDFEESPTKAGGILVYQDDNTLLRLACGVHFDGEISFTVKSPELGFFVPGRGLLEEKKLALRVARCGDRFEAWCGSGGNWYKCAEAEVKMKGKVQAGIFAECTYRALEIERCTAVPLKFRAVSVKCSNPDLTC